MLHSKMTNLKDHIAIYRKAALGLLALAKDVLSEDKWEPPVGDRKNWRKRNQDGTYEYRETPPEQTSQSQQQTDQSTVTQDGQPEQKAKKVVKKVVYKKYLKLDKPKLQETLTKGHFTIISAGRNSKDPKEALLEADDEMFHMRHEELRKELEKANLSYTEVVGHYGGKEPSFLVFHDDTQLTPKTQKSMMVHHRDKEEAKEHRQIMEELGKKFNQDSVLCAAEGRNEIVFTTGSHTGKTCGGHGWKEVPDAEDYYTDIELSSTQHTKFSLDIQECFDRGLL